MTSWVQEHWLDWWAIAIYFFLVAAFCVAALDKFPGGGEKDER